MQVEASDKKGLRHLAKVTTSIVVLMIIEAIFLIAYLRDDLNWMEYLQTSLGTLIICMLFVPSAYLSQKKHNRNAKLKKDWTQIIEGKNENGLHMLVLKNRLQRSFSGIFASFLLVLIVLWRLGVEENFSRKILCVIFFGIAIVLCLLISWCIYHAKLIFSFQHDRFSILKTTGLMMSEEIEFAYKKHPTLKVGKVDESNTVELLSIECDDMPISIKYKMPLDAANKICSYINEHITHYGEGCV
jgi:hypothetical protein